MQTIKRFLLATLAPKQLRVLRKQYLALRLAANTLPVEAESAIVPALLSPGRQALDLGANLGLYTTLLGRHLGHRGRVYAIEPLQENFEILEQVLRLKRLRNVRSYLEAIGERSGTGEILIPDMGEYKGMYWAKLKTASNNSRGMKREVRVRSLDDFVREEGITDLDFIKCDVEGGEVGVIQGGRETLARFKPSLLIEICENTCAAVFSPLKELGYQPFVLRGNRLERTEKFLQGEYSNYIFLHPESAGWARAQEAGLIHQ